jgi:hypothetical protein
MTSDELQQSVEALEMVLKSMDQVRDHTNRYNAALRDHARSLRGYAVGANMVATRDERGQRINVGDNRVSERLLVHCANYYDRLAESQEQLVSPIISLLIQARTYLEEYNMLNNYAAKHFKTLARDSAKLDGTLKELTRKLSKLTHKTAAPGTANTQNASTVQNAGVHEIYVQKLTGLSSQIQRVRQDHLAVYTREQKTVDRHVGRTFARCTRQNYDFLGNALLKTGTSEAIGGVNAWGVYANANISPPINELDGEADGEGEIGDEWEPSQEDGDELMSPRQLAQQQGPRPPSAFTDFSSLMTGPDNRGNRSHANMSLNMQGKLPSHPSQTAFQAYPGPSQQSQQPLQTQQSQQYLPPQPPVSPLQGISNLRMYSLQYQLGLDKIR